MAKAPVRGKGKNDVAQKKLVTPKFRVSFPHVFEPKGFEGQKPVYSVTMLFPGDIDLKAADKNGVSFMSAARFAAEEKFGPIADWAPRFKGKFKWPWRDGEDFPELDGYKDSIFIRATSKTQPFIYDQRRDPVQHPEDFYAGCYARAQIIAFAYETAGNHGVSFALQMLQKVSEGEPFTGRDKPEDVFDVIEEEENDGVFEERPKKKTSAYDDEDAYEAPRKKRPTAYDDDEPVSRKSKRNQAYDDDLGF